MRRFATLFGIGLSLLFGSTTASASDRCDANVRIGRYTPPYASPASGSQEYLVTYSHDKPSYGVGDTFSLQIVGEVVVSINGQQGVQPLRISLYGLKVGAYTVRYTNPIAAGPAAEVNVIEALCS